MAEARRLDVGPLLIGLVALAPALFALGAGWIDGDAAAYAVGDPRERWTHAAYAALLRAVDGDLLSWMASLLTVLGAARLGGDRRLAAAGAAAVVLPWAPFAEVDPVWIAAIVWAAAGPWWLAAFAVAISPTALLATPWAGGRAALAGLLAVAALTLLSGGLWWTGPRGVLEDPVLMPGRALEGWLLHLPWALLPAAVLGRERRALLLLPLLLAPPDVPAWVLGGVALAAMASRAREPWVLALVLGQLAIGGFELWRRHERVRAEQALVERVARALGPDDGLVAPWTWGARIAVAASGDPYGIRWHPPGRWLRDQRARWCADPPARVLVLAGDCADDCPERRAAPRCERVDRSPR